MKTILFPLDFSPVSMRALPPAASLAEKTGAKLVLMHNILPASIWSTTTKSPHVDRDHQRQAQTAESRLREVKQSDKLARVNCDVLVTEGVTHEQIVTTAHSLKAEMIIMGSHGNMQGRRFVDSNIQKIMRDASCPVMLVNDDTRAVSWQKMLVPASFNENLRDEFETICDLARQLGSMIILLYVNMPEKFKDTPQILRQMETFTERAPDLAFETVIYNHHELETAILRYAGEVKADYIAMVTHDHKHQAKYLISATETIAYHSPAPVISIPIRKPELVM